MARAIASRLLHEPTLRLKRAAGEDGLLSARARAARAVRARPGLREAGGRGRRGHRARLQASRPRPPVRRSEAKPSPGVLSGSGATAEPAFEPAFGRDPFQRAGGRPGRGGARPRSAARSWSPSRTSRASPATRPGSYGRVERALLDGEVDLGVHSAKDVPGEMPDELALVGVPEREDPADAFVGDGRVDRRASRRGDRRDREPAPPVAAARRAPGPRRGRGPRQRRHPPAEARRGRVRRHRPGRRRAAAAGAGRRDRLPVRRRCDGPRARTGLAGAGGPRRRRRDGHGGGGDQRPGGTGGVHRRASGHRGAWRPPAKRRSASAPATSRERWRSPATPGCRTAASGSATQLRGDPDQPAARGPGPRRADARGGCGEILERAAEGADERRKARTRFASLVRGLFRDGPARSRLPGRRRARRPRPDDRALAGADRRRRRDPLRPPDPRRGPRRGARGRRARLRRQGAGRRIGPDASSQDRDPRRARRPSAAGPARSCA